MPATPKRQYSNVHLPTKLLTAIGHVAALWARIEYTIDSKINEALALPGAAKVNQKMMIPFNNRLKLLDGLCKQFLSDAENKKMAKQIIADLKQLSGLRNLIVHGAMPHLGPAKKRRGAYWFMRMRWDTPARVVEKRALTARQVEAFATKLSDQFAYAGMIEVFFWSVHASHGKSVR